MLWSRRAFCGLVASGPAAPWVVGQPRAPGPIRLDSNENPYGPFPAARAAMTRALDDGGRYPSSQSLVAALAAANGVAEANLLLTVGATEGLAISAQAFTSKDAPLVTAAPTYGAIATAAEQLGTPVIRVPVRGDGGLDLEMMAERATGAGVVYVCNPNNPTGALIPADRLGAFFATAATRAPAATIVVGEAYHEYLDDPGYRSAAAEAVTNPRVVVTRTFSKLYGLAGLRIGYLIGHPETLERVGRHRVSLGANNLAVAAAIASLQDEPERLRQRRLNAEGRRRAERFFVERGWRCYPATANYLFVDVKRDIVAFRAQCQERGLLIGRLYPPANTWARITIGTPDEMDRAFAILQSVL